MMIFRPPRAVTLGAAAALLASGLGIWSPAAAAPQGHRTLVSQRPAATTPHVIGRVNAIVEHGDKVFVGGNFTRVKTADGRTTMVRTHLFAFSKSTGRIDTAFTPRLDGPVNALALRSSRLYIGGAFKTVEGRALPRLAMVSTTSGNPITAFAPPAPSAAVNTLDVLGSDLLVGGVFRKVGSTERVALASVHVTSGKLTNKARSAFAGVRVSASGRKAPVQVVDTAISPNGRWLIVAGSFASIDGYERHQIALFDTAPSRLKLAPWYTKDFEPHCMPKFPSYVRDVDINSDGRSFAVATSGGSKRRMLCDTVSHWPLSPNGRNQHPRWIAYTGGDTVSQVSAVGDVVYVGGHHRWFNNPFGNNNAGEGAVSRIGIGALDIRNGLPVAWNPTRRRGVGVFEFLPVDDGLWVGHDTTVLGGQTRPGIAFLPLAGGEGLPADHPAELPVEVMRLGPFSGDRALSQRTFRKFTGRASTEAGGGPEKTGWGAARGAFTAGGAVYVGWSNGTLRRYRVNGHSISSHTKVNLYRLGAFAAELKNITSMAYLDGQLLYTVEGKNALFMRHFGPSARVVGAWRVPVVQQYPGLDWSKARGSFIADRRLYVALDDGTLRSVALGLVQGAVPRGAVLTPKGKVAVVPGTGIGKGKVDWRARGLAPLAK